MIDQKVPNETPMVDFFIGIRHKNQKPSEIREGLLLHKQNLQEGPVYHYN
jgi:hypothetical protein